MAVRSAVQLAPRNGHRGQVNLQFSDGATVSSQACPQVVDSGKTPDVHGQLRNKPARWMNKQSWTKPAGGSATPKKCLRCPLTGSSANTGRYKP